MIARSPTGRCAQEDLPELRQTRDGIHHFLEQQHPAWSGIETFAGSTRADTFTFHNGQGRGAVWQDHRRGVLWLCCASDHHDAGYAHGHDLAAAERLYPELDVGYLDGVSATVPWGECRDEDRLEALRFTGAAVSVFGAEVNPSNDSPVFDDGFGWMRLSVEDDVWTITIRRTLVYSDEALARDRWLSDHKLERVFVELTGQDADEAEFWAPPYDVHHINIHFLGGAVAPQEWLTRRIQVLLRGGDEQALGVR